MAASTIQKSKIVQAFDNVLEQYECDCVFTKDLNRLLDQVAEMVTSSTTDNVSSPVQRRYTRSSIQEKVRLSKDRAVTKFLMFRGSL